MSCNCRAGACIFHQYEAAKWSGCEGDNPSYKFRANFLQLILLPDSRGIRRYQFVYSQTIQSATDPIKFAFPLQRIHSSCVRSARDGVQMFPCRTQTGESAFPNKTMKVHFNICTDVLWARGSGVKGGSDSLADLPPVLCKNNTSSLQENCKNNI